VKRAIDTAQVYDSGRVMMYAYVYVYVYVYVLLYYT
jgi:hypothetical protein